VLEQRFTLSPTGYEILKQELATWETPYQERFPDTNNPPTDLTREKTANSEIFVQKEYIEERITDLKYILARAEIANYGSAPLLADLDDRVTVWDFNEKCEWVFKLVSSVKTSAARDGIPGREVSLDSPVGKALLGKCVGDVVEIKVPDGKAKYVIRRIELIA
jgi:transcription elongation factor GreA